jgi:hypothetical protein
MDKNKVLDNQATGKIRPEKLSQIILSAVALCLLAISCGKKDEGKPATLSLKQPEIQGYPEAKAPDIAPDFRWNFSYKKTYIYSWEQENDQELDTGAGKQKYSVSGTGMLRVKSHGDNTADLVLQDIRLKMAFDEAFGGKREPVEQNPPPVVMQNIKDNGTGLTGNSEQETFLKLLFPFPDKSLNVGESVDMPAQMSFKAMDLALQVKGRSRITLVRYVKIGSRTCAQLESDADISELKVPEELKGENSCVIKAKSVCYFDIINRCFIEGTIASTTKIAIDAPVIKSDKLSGAQQPERAKMAMFINGIISISLKGTE